MVIPDAPPIYIRHSSYDPDITDIADPAWNEAISATISKYWSGEQAPGSQHFRAGLLWSDNALYVRFEANQSGPLVVNENPKLTKKVHGLWERDVCEIFIAPDIEASKKYFEFEVAPTGEWLDLAIDITSGVRVTDLEYDSGMEAAARIEEGRVLTAMKIPWEAFGRKPKPGDVWLGNIFRCVGSEPDRGYLAWSPTMTKTPNFHVPERFGQLIFETRYFTDPRPPLDTKRQP